MSAAEPPRDDKDYYAILGVGRGATPREIAAAFHALASKYHPDVARGQADAERKIREINEAYDTLSDPAKRRRYDRSRSLRRTSSQGVRRGGPRAGPVGGVFGSEEVGPPRPADVFVDLLVRPEEARWGAVCEFQLTLSEPCARCGGGESARSACAACGGEGRVRQRRLMRVVVPAGSYDGLVLRAPGQGRAHPRGGPRGDLCLRIRVRPCW